MTAVAKRTRLSNPAAAAEVVRRADQGRDRARIIFLLVQEVRDHVDLPTHYFRADAIASRERLHALEWALGVHEATPDTEMVTWLQTQGVSVVAPPPETDVGRMEPADLLRQSEEDGDAA